MGSILFEDIFVVEGKDTQGKYFDKVSRFECQGENYEMELTLDINTDIYPLKVGTKLTLALATSISLDGGTEERGYNVREAEGESLADNYEYVMYGKVFKFEQVKGSAARLAICVSFGGLLMQLTGDPRNLHGISLDKN
eukprot:CAMPEP_0119134540 /NCGR_PEP_ID=MMETSP1310-20130426/17135_1 /TAXON_ID=464262 /ORGANISM="Genus nov. species nov., Strain RCC2339" /LENGTH=138 /DNA_ID=CAMNT_0007125341 /DNA_START=293 /DNA_END=706 /DNA_ORIENTATION=-